MRLSLRSFLICLVLLLGIFVGLNPIWKNQDMSAWNENIWWSYIPIPLMVAFFLKLESKLAFSSLLLETLKMTFTKFVITITAANVMWGILGVPGTGEAPNGPLLKDASELSYEPSTAPPKSVLDPARMGRLIGIVTDSDGAPVAEALVWIASGLEDLNFVPPGQELQVDNDGSGFNPSQVVLQAYQALNLTSVTGTLHTAVLENEQGKNLLNSPILANEPRTLMFKRDHGLLQLSCSVHGADESEATILVSANPFHVRTDSKGHFLLDGVPFAELTVRASHAQLGSGRTDHKLKTSAPALLQIGLERDR